MVLPTLISTISHMSIIYSGRMYPMADPLSSPPPPLTPTIEKVFNIDKTRASKLTAT